MTTPRITRRQAIKTLAATGIAAPFVFRKHVQAAPSETVLHASFGGGGRAMADVAEAAGSKHFKLVAIADVDLGRAAEMKKRFPEAKVYQDWRELLDKEKGLNSVNISTPDHMHAPMTMRAMQMGLAVCTQKPLTHTIQEARALAKFARDKKLVTQMGIQIHSNATHKAIVEIVHGGAIGKVKEVHSWSGKDWGDRGVLPDRKDPVPEGLSWDGWLGVAAERPFIGGGYYHPGNWRKRLDFGCGTFGDMGCHIIDPVFGALALTTPNSVTSVGEAPNATNWSLDVEVKFIFPGTKYTTETVAFTWYNGKSRPPQEIVSKIGDRKLHDQGSIYIGTDGVLYSPYIAPPVLLPAEKFADFKMPKTTSDNHYAQFIEAVRGNGKTSAPFEYSGPLTELVLLGCLATRFPKQTLQFDSENLKFTNVKEATALVHKKYRKGWEVEGL
jgi:predicted dehydrogenase